MKTIKTDISFGDSPRNPQDERKSFLEGTKIQKRPFLEVLNFLPVPRSEYLSLLPCLGTHGVNFFRKNIRNNPKYLQHDFWTSQTFKITSINTKVSPFCELGWEPSENQLHQYSLDKLRRHSLESLEYTIENQGNIGSLSFIFTGNIRSPKETAYKNDRELIRYVF
jgi:hypothetical protein